MVKKRCPVEIVEKICQVIEGHLEEPLRLADLSERVGLSTSYLQRLFKRITGITPRQYADACRLGHFKVTLREEGNVTTAMIQSGYSSSSRLYEKTDAQLGMTPDTYRRGGKGMEIFYTISECPLGKLLLGATERGISAVYLGEEERLLEGALKTEYPAAEIVREDALLQEWLQQILLHLEGEQPHLDLPLDVQATAFQWRVWQELQKIPYGTTTTYGAIAEALGQPDAVRAVGRACATNPVSLVIPCHRVVRRDGDPGGYRWGLERKRALLEQEKKATEESENA